MLLFLPGIIDDNSIRSKFHYLLVNDTLYLVFDMFFLENCRSQIDKPIL